ncbi:ABC transporter ATP-binding protein [Brevibacillus laterosporus]|uniref:ABC transporter ATP-binding protein n=1 Tax=Brevibacillus laterosporus TaxID=1465 RepID=UPI000CE3DCE2|nr:ATP-binding cassette domain-containing protein [Brevibacillus laterosporus]MED1666745.1 ATP-binding cassette domain-containing protein [Brevibacillus laterosporus]MED1671881.1 ATP-binding cassette domain-containing protein [Brevibacillus laterosporus]MED1720989.1 ATP-binding cassette domain-containing protein [Brevibacillus laterosporus]PPA81460.1 ABC transporter ATP-binding protein [Brevibacillus laterosporus]
MKEIKIEVNHVHKVIGRRKIIDDISFEVLAGDICGFIGPNGAGKTTLIRMMTGLIKPTEGQILINGVDVTTNRERALMEIGAMVETPIFFEYMSGRKNLQNLARLNPDMSRKEQLHKVEQVLEIVGLKTDKSDRGNDKVKTYSLGMKQRLGIAQSLLNNPRIIILDEPANGLDPMGMRELRELIVRLKERFGITFFISSHLLDELQKICNRYVIIKEGTMKWCGDDTSLLDQMEKAMTLEDAFMNMMSQ